MPSSGGVFSFAPVGSRHGLTSALLPKLPPCWHREPLHIPAPWVPSLLRCPVSRGSLCPYCPRRVGCRTPLRAHRHILRWALPHPLQKELRLIWSGENQGVLRTILIFFPHLSRTTFLKNGQDFAFSASRGQLPAQQAGLKEVCVHVCTCMNTMCTCVYRVYMCVCMRT